MSSNNEYFLIDQLVTRANAALSSDLAVTERTVRYYMSYSIVSKGLKIKELPAEFVSTISQRGNQRYFTVNDSDTVVATRMAIHNGASIESLGGRQSSKDDDLFATPKLVSRSMMGADSSDFSLLSESRTYSMRSNSISEITSDYEVLPEVQKSWTLQLRSDLALTGTGPEPTHDQVRDLQKFITLNFAPALDDENWGSSSYDQPAIGKVRIEIELVDIAAPFNGLLVNASNAEVTPGGGASGRIWEVCGVDELLPQRIDLDLPLLPGKVAFTTAGNGESRGFTGVLHAYGPRWTSPVDKESLHKGKKQIPQHGEEETLIRTWRNILHMADERQEDRLAAPLISSGLFGYPFLDCAETTFETILTTPTRVTHVHIRTVSRRSFDQLVETRNRVLRQLNIA